MFNTMTEIETLTGVELQFNAKTRLTVEGWTAAEGDMTDFLLVWGPAGRVLADLAALQRLGLWCGQIHGRDAAWQARGADF